jgi:anthranilate phosphoribosyltransferase
MIDKAIRKLIDGQHLDREEMAGVFGEMMDGRATDVQKSAFLVALRMKGETVDEITGAAVAMRERVTPLGIDADGVVDTCGTGGDGSNTFNISTIAALVVAGAGVAVAKHGNRAMSSSCGSADVLSALGVKVDVPAERLSQVLRRVGIAFLFAPKMHPAMAAVIGVRRELGVRTIFNALGPLTNPVFPRRQVLGVYSDELVEKAARVLMNLGAQHVIVAHSRDGMDEISLSAPTHVCELRDGELRSYDLRPDDLGLPEHPLEALAGGDAAHNARIVRAVLEGEEGARRDAVLAAAGAALYVSGTAATLRDGVATAREAIASGAALRKLEELIAVTNELA